MWEALSRYRGLILVGVLLLAPLALLWAQTRAPGARGPVAGVLVDVAAVIERGLLAMTGVIDDGIAKYVSSVASADELIRLRRDAYRVAATEARLREIEIENEELRALAKVADRIDGPRPIGARVIGRSGAPLTRIARIDRGRSDGVQRGDGVVASSGVVGQVLASGRHASDVLLLTDPSSALDVVVQRTRARGIVRGTGGDEAYRARVEDFDRLADVVPGDVLVTSGVGSHFPPGLLVGEILDVQKRGDSLYQRAEVKPASRVERIERVLVLIRREPERMPRLGSEPEELEDAGPTADDAGIVAPDEVEAPPPPKPKPKPVPREALAPAMVEQDAGSSLPREPSAKPEGATTRKPQPEEPKPAKAQPAKAQPEKAKPANAKPEEAKPEEAKPEGAQPAKAKPDDPKPEKVEPAGSTEAPP